MQGCFEGEEVLGGRDAIELSRLRDLAGPMRRLVVQRLADQAARGPAPGVARRAEEVAAMDERTLPVYTILVPLYKEAAVVPRLVTGMEGLDYPKTKLDIRLLCEEDDEETSAPRTRRRSRRCGESRQRL